MKTKILLYLFTIIILLSTLSFSAYADETIELSVISANVSGLPAFLSKYDRDVQKSQKTLGQMLNESGYDIICVQEDFQYHDILAAEMTNYPYFTYSSGGVPVGDGVNIFSKYPIYNIERVTWKEYNGIFADGLDGLTPKGFIKCTVRINAALIDIYNLHGDSYRTENDQLAKKAQLIQLTEYINENSKSRPVIITGDTNLTFHNDSLAEMYSILIEENGFTDVWVEVKNGGNYFQGKDADTLIAAWYDKFGGHDWGRWDSVERVLYKNGYGLKFKPIYFEYKIYTDNKEAIKSLTDHRIMECTLELDITDYERTADITLSENKKPSVFTKVIHNICVLIRFIWILLLGIMQLILSNTYSTIIFIAFIFLVLYMLIRKVRMQKRR